MRTVPFRTKFFIGYDLDGNTYWEFHNPNNPYRPRRIVEYRENKGNWVDYEMPPQWMQWLRFTRPNYPTLEELYADKVRQETLILKVKAAEARWKSIPLKQKTSPQSATDVLKQYEDQAQAQEQLQSELGHPKPADMFQPPKSAADLTPGAQEAISRKRGEPVVESLDKKKKEDKYAEPPKPVVQANPSDAFEPGTWTMKKPIKRG